MKTRASLGSKNRSTKMGPYAGLLTGGIIGAIMQHGSGATGKSRGNVRKNLKGTPKKSSSHAKGEYDSSKNSMHHNSGPADKGPIKPAYAKKPSSTSAPTPKGDAKRMTKPARKPKYKGKTSKSMRKASKKFNFGQEIRRGFGQIR